MIHILCLDIYIICESKRNVMTVFILPLLKSISNSMILKWTENWKLLKM